MSLLSSSFTKETLKNSLNALKTMGSGKLRQFSLRVEELRHTYDDELQREDEEDRLNGLLGQLKEKALTFRKSHPGMPLPFSLAMEIAQAVRSSSLPAEEQSAWLDEYTRFTAPREWEDVTEIGGLPFSPGEIFSQRQIRLKAAGLQAQGFRPWVKVSGGARYLYPVIHPLILLAHHEPLLATIWNDLPLSSEIKQKLLLPAAVFLAEHASTLPASEGNHDFGPAGLFRHSLLTLSKMIAEVRNKEIIPARDSPGHEVFWSIVIVLTLTHDLGKTVTDFEIYDAKERPLKGFGPALPLTLAAARVGETFSLVWQRNRAATHKAAALDYRKALLERLFSDQLKAMGELVSMDLLLSCDNTTEATAIARERRQAVPDDDRQVRRDLLTVSLLTSLYESDHQAVSASRREDSRDLGDRELANLRLHKVLTEHYVLPLLNEQPDLKSSHAEHLKTKPHKLKAKPSGFAPKGSKESSVHSGAQINPHLLDFDLLLPYLKVSLPASCTEAIFVFYGCALYEELLNLRNALTSRGTEREQLTNLLRRLGMVYQVGPTQALGWFGVSTGGKTLGYVYGLLLKVESSLFSCLQGECYQLRFMGTRLPATVKICAKLTGAGTPDTTSYPYLVDLSQASRDKLTSATSAFFSPVLKLIDEGLLKPLSHGASSSEDKTAATSDELPKEVTITDSGFVLFRYTRLDEIIRAEMEKRQLRKNHALKARRASHREVRKKISELDQKEDQIAKRHLSAAQKDLRADDAFVNELLDDMLLDG